MRVAQAHARDWPGRASPVPEYSCRAECALRLGMPHVVHRLPDCGVRLLSRHAVVACMGIRLLEGSLHSCRRGAASPLVGNDIWSEYHDEHLLVLVELLTEQRLQQL